jgi:predicted DNA-binding transcriptional regulator YafY
LTPIQRALAERRVLALDYLGGQRNELTKRHVEPLGLVYYSDNWHLIGYCRLRRDVRDFRTDRIVRLQLQNELFSGHGDFSLKGYLKTKKHDGNFEMGRIRFQPEAMERVRRERSWGLVEEESKSEGIEVTLLDYSLEWLACWILSFGSMAEALAPERLRELVAGEAEKIAVRYAAAHPLTSSSSARSSVQKVPALSPRSPDAKSGVLTV